MGLLGLGVAPLVGVKDSEIIQDGGDVGVLGAELFLVEMQRVQVIGLGGFLPTGLAVEQGDVVEHGAEIRVGQIVELGGGLRSAFS